MPPLPVEWKNAFTTLEDMIVGKKARKEVRVDGFSLRVHEGYFELKAPDSRAWTSLGLSADEARKGARQILTDFQRTAAHREEEEEEREDDEEEDASPPPLQHMTDEEIADAAERLKVMLAPDQRGVRTEELQAGPNTFIVKDMTSRWSLRLQDGTVLATKHSEVIEKFKEHNPARSRKSDRKKAVQAAKAVLVAVEAHEENKDEGENAEVLGGTRPSQAKGVKGRAIASVQAPVEKKRRTTTLAPSEPVPQTQNPLLTRLEALIADPGDPEVEMMRAHSLAFDEIKKKHPEKPASEVSFLVMQQMRDGATDYESMVQERKELVVHARDLLQTAESVACDAIYRAEYEKKHGRPAPPQPETNAQRNTSAGAAGSSGSK